MEQSDVRTRELLDEFMEEEPIGQDSLEILSKTVERFQILEKEIEIVEQNLKSKKKELENISREGIPTILNKTGLSEIRLSTGEKIQVLDKIHASITKGNTMLAYRKMIEAEGGDEQAQKRIDSLFKSGIFIRNLPEEQEDEVMDILLEKDIPYEREHTIHSATLKKYCSEKFKQGLEIPEGISTFTYQETKISK